MKLLNNSKMRVQVFSILSLSVVMVGLFQNCAQTGELSLSTSMNVQDQKMSNTFYVLKNSTDTHLKPILTNKEADALLVTNISNSQLAKSPSNNKLESSNSAEVSQDSNLNNTAQPVVESEPVQASEEIYEIELPTSFPLKTEHGKVTTIDKKTGVFVYEPNLDFVGNDKLILIKMIKMEVTAETKSAIKFDDGKYYLVETKPVAVTLVVHDHELPTTEKSANQMTLQSAEDTELVRVMGPIESDKSAPDKPSNIDDGKYPDKLPKSPKATWGHGLDADSGINFYEVAIGRQPGESDIVKWTNVGFVTSVSLEGKFNPDQLYYTSVRAVDFAGLRSDVTTGDGWQASQITSDALIAEVTSSKYSTSNKIEFKIKFSQPVDKLTISQLTLTNIKGTPVLTGASRNYSVTVDANAQGNVELKILKSSIVDVFGNKNIADVSSVTLFDNIVPTLVSIKSDLNPMVLNKSKISMKVSFTFSENITTELFSLANNVSISNPAAGSFDNLVCSATICSANFTASDLFTSDGGGITISYKDKSTFMDVAGNLGLNKSTSLNTIVIDRQSPSVQISVGTSDNDTVGSLEKKTILFTFNEAVIGFNKSIIDLSDTSLGSLSDPLPSGTSGKVYAAIYTPLEGVSGSVNISLKSNYFTDLAKNPGETATPFNLKVATKVFTDAEGGQISYNGDYKIHTFSNANTGENFTVKKIGNDKTNATNNNFEILVVGGGAGGEWSSDQACWISSYAGGGGGGINYQSNVPMNIQSYSVTVGAGGGPGGNGGVSTLSSYSATGAVGRNGGSGSYRNGGTGSFGGRSSSNDCKWGCPNYNSGASDATTITLVNGLRLSLSAGGGAGSAITRFITNPQMVFVTGTAGGAGGGGRGGINEGESGSSATGGPGVGYGSGGGGGGRVGLPSSYNCNSRNSSSGSGYSGVVIVSYKYK